MSWEGEGRKPGERPRRREEEARGRAGGSGKVTPANTLTSDFHFPQMYLSHLVIAPSGN